MRKERGSEAEAAKSGAKVVEGRHRTGTAAAPEEGRRIIAGRPEWRKRSVGAVRRPRMGARKWYKLGGSRA